MVPADSNPDPTEVARLLESIRDADDTDAKQTLLPIIYGELRALAASYLRSLRPDHTLQPTALVNEAFVRMLGETNLGAESREHFFRIGAQAMRWVLADHARRRRADRRGGGEERQRITLSALDSDSGDDLTFDASEVSDALTELSELDPRQAEVVELRFFGGLTIDQIANVLGVSRRTVDVDWKFARGWLRKRLQASIE